MRLWSIHPTYLDQKGLGALWREGLLGQKVLLGQTKGYRHHPQLVRFRQSDDPIATISYYLREVVREAVKRGYHFDETKIVGDGPVSQLSVTVGQLEYEWHHLQTKLQARAPAVYEQNLTVSSPQAHPLFVVVPGEVEAWERR